VTDYYHWLTDYLVQVFALEVYQERTGTVPTVLIPADPPGWLKDSLSLAGINLDRTREWLGNRVRCSRLAVGALRRHTFSTSDGYIHSPAAMARLGDRIRDVVLDSEFDTDTVNRPDRIYVSRSDAEDRRIRNEDELMSMLNNYGFKRIVPGEHTFREQVRQFSDAEIVLGPHGAGLTNIIFSTETTLVELFGSYRNACFFTLANGIGHGYVSVTCHSQANDIIAEVSEIESLIQDFLNRVN
jgi:capsular polysaccharide biosynthesis protein